MKKLLLDVKISRIFFIYLILCIPLLSLLFSVAPSNQRFIVSGKVEDAQGMPIVGVHVMSKNTTNGVVTNFDGHYKIEVYPSDTLIFSALGFKSLTKSVNNQNQINVQLEEDITELGEIMINAGYYSVKEEEQTGNIERVTAKDIETQPVANPLAALQGRMSGVYITQQSGVPGAGFTVRIRGQNSITKGNDPFYIVDGVPYISSTIASLGTAIVSSANPLSSINPADIESVEVLKDADATAIYGSRGANGVVLITTKKGKEGKTEVSFNLQTGVGSVANIMSLLNTPQYLEMRKEAFQNDGTTSNENNAPDLHVWDQNRYTNWQDELIGGTSYITDSQVKISGGNSQTQFLFGGSTYKETTVFPGDFDYKRFSMNLSVNHTSENKRFSSAMNMIYSDENSTLPDEDLTYAALTLPPNLPELIDENGDLIFYRGLTNPLRSTFQRFDANNATFIANAQISYRLLKGLKAKASLGYNSIFREEKEIRSRKATNPLSSTLPSSDFADASVNSWIIEPQLEYNHSFGNLALQTLVGATFQQLDQNSKSLRASGYINDAIMEDISAAADVDVLNADISQYKYQAVYGRVHLDFKKRYFLNFTARRDGSSRFGENNRFANFGALGAAWLFSKEKLFDSEKGIFSFGKFRASYGSTGNDQIGDYGYLDSYSPTSFSYQGVSGLYPTRLNNPNFGWERNIKFEVGLDLGFLRDRIMLSGVYYNNQSDNQLIGLPLPTSVGYSFLQSNLDASVENRGWEFNLETTNVITTNFSWVSQLNLTISNTLLVNYPNLETSAFANRYREGESMFIQPLFHTIGVNSDTGIYEFEDVDSDGVISAPNDYQFLQEVRPEFYGGFLNT
ncbi:SusC/RagA family TonB-linked outer membrane protein, partial [Tamlana sp. 2_MG-2023]|uniref:SusC/RagA family TonB-linked outer membrane protein n=1 Tax=unclassified Tamlana TaxID=2614803 RepID=UPI0026E3B19A